MQQVRIEMKRLVHLGLHLFTESIARVVIETKHHSLTDLGDYCKCVTEDYPVNQESTQSVPVLLIRRQPLASFPDRKTNFRRKIMKNSYILLNKNERLLYGMI